MSCRGTVRHTEVSQIHTNWSSLFFFQFDKEQWICPKRRKARPFSNAEDGMAPNGLMSPI
jgi:hypothetical protein